MRKQRFTFLCNTQERQLLAALAKHLKRSQSDAIRWLVVEAAQELEVKVCDEIEQKMSDEIQDPQPEVICHGD